ncbi:MAG: hypothetical protein HQM08_28310 [Candidatus Riflebacteria bacterium]|nr:hypothetical protein [Candidatus Riflebacteria bacterium]
MAMNNIQLPGRKIPPIICLTGVDGCGKSTHIKRLRERIQLEKGKKCEILSVWDITNLPKYQTHPFISDRTVIHRYLASLHSPARALFILHALMESLDSILEKKPDIILAEGYWYKYILTETLHFQNSELLFKFAEAFPLPSKVVLLDVPPEDVWERKPTVTLYECGFSEPSRDSFIAFQSLLRKIMIEFCKHKGWKAIDARPPQDDVASEIWKQIKDEV